MRSSLESGRSAGPVMRRAIASLVGACAFVFGLATLASAQDVVSQVPSPPASADATVRSGYVLGADDVLLVRVADVPEIGAQPVRIDPAGEIRLPMVGTIRAAGMTLEELEAELFTRLKVNIQEPSISVIVTEFHKQPIVVIGSVQRAGVLEIQGAKTLIEVLSLAGGLGPDAGPVLRIARRREWGSIPLPDASVDPASGFSTVDIDLKSLLAASSPEKNIMVRPHDVITVAKAEVVFVIGEVGRPGPVPVTGRSLSAMEAVAASGGALRTAKAAQARILRAQAGSETRTEIPLDLKKIMQGGRPDVPLVVGDILVIPDNGGRRALIRAVEMAAQAGIMIGTWTLVR